MHQTNLTPAFTAGALAAVKAMLRPGDFREMSGRIDAVACAADLMRRFPTFDKGLIAAAVMSRLSEDPLHVLA